MRTLSGRIGIVLLVFALATLLAIGGSLWFALRELHRPVEAATALHEALARSPEHPLALLELSQLEAQAGRASQAAA